MNHAIVQSPEGITIAGGGPFSSAALNRALARAPRLVAADGGADRLLALGRMPEAVVGDMDSLSAGARARLDGRLHEIGEQATTDFDKVLRSAEAPFALALGFAGGRIDHGLAVLHGLVRHGTGQQHGMGPEARAPYPVFVIGPKDLAFHAPAGRMIELRLRAGDPLSLFPMQAVAGQGSGLDWPIEGLAFHPARLIGTSNRVTRGPVRLCFDGAGMLVILPLGRLDAAIGALVPQYRRPPGRQRAG